MNITVIIFAVVVFLPLLLALLQRANAGAMFLATCSAMVLLGTLDPSLVGSAGSAFPSEGEAIVRTLVIVVALLYATIMFRRSVHGLKMFLNIVCSILLGAMLASELPRLTGLSLFIPFVGETWWQQLNSYNSIIVLSGLALSLYLIYHRPTKKEKKKHHD